jgi:hypothetical protein
MRKVMLCLLMLQASGCDYLDSYVFAKSAPKILWLDDGKDGQSIMACKGDIHVNFRDAGYQIEFTDADGLNHTLYGVKRFSLSDIPPLVKSSIPYPEPSLYDFNKENSLPTYSSGETIHSGSIVVWKTGEQAKFVIDHDAKGNETRHWESVWIHNQACDPSR